MGYPVARQAPSGAPAPGRGYQPPTVPNSVGDIFRIPMKDAVNDIAKLPLARWFRYLPWLRGFMTALDYYEMYRSAMNAAGYTNNCNRAASGCEYDILGTFNLAGVPLCIGTGGPTNAPYSGLPGGIATYGEWNGVGAGCLGLRYTKFQLKGWRMNAGNTIKPYAYKPWPKSHPIGDPWASPWDNPITEPYTLPRPLPWIGTPYRPNPWDDPSPVDPPPVRRPPGRPDPRPRPRTDPDPKPRTDPDPLPPPPPKKPDPDPDPKVKKPPPRPGPKFHERNKQEQKLDQRLDPQNFVRVANASRGNPSRPGKHVKEVKLRGGGVATAGSLTWWVANVVTETRDFIKSLHKALPDRCKTKTKTKGPTFSKFSARNAPSVQQMFKEVYTCIAGKSPNALRPNEREAYWNKAIDNVIEDQIKDYIFGKAGRALAEASRRTGRPIGYGAGPSL